MKTAPVGAMGTKAHLVTQNDTAIAVGSGSLQVLGTPVLLALMEEATCLAVEAYLEGDETTVGSAVALEHMAPTLVAQTVTATASLEDIDGRLLTFQVTASDESGTVGKATIKRYLVSANRFMDKARSK